MSENQSATAMNSDNSISPSSYSKDSFNRFDDNVVENILSFLTLNEKVLLESVSKRWKTHIYKRQKTLVLKRYGDEESTDTLNRLIVPIEVVDFVSGWAHSHDYKSINKFALNSILKKCQSIESVVLGVFVYFDFEIMDIICRNSLKLKSIILSNPIGLNKDDLDHLGRTYGHQFERIHLETIPQRFWYLRESSVKYWKQFLFYCKNLREVLAEYINEELLENNNYLPKLQFIDDYYFDFEDLDPMNNFKKICDKFCKTLKRFKCDFIYINEDISQLLPNLCKLKRLQYLNLNIKCLKHENYINQYMNQLSENLPELKELSISIYTIQSNINYFITPFVGFKNMKILTIDIYRVIAFSERFEVNGSVECFKSMENLKKLVLMIDSIGDEFFKDIDKYLPNLSILCISGETHPTNITDKTIIQLSNLKKFSELHLRNQKNCKLITDKSICAVINGCPLFQEMTFSSLPNITDKTIKALISVANLYPKRQLFFNFKIYFDTDSEIPSIDLNSFKIPENLKIYI